MYELRLNKGFQFVKLIVFKLFVKNKKFGLKAVKLKLKDEICVMVVNEEIRIIITNKLNTE
jgi:hypothetical protein